MLGESLEIKAHTSGDMIDDVFGDSPVLLWNN